MPSLQRPPLRSPRLPYNSHRTTDWGGKMELGRLGVWYFTEAMPAQDAAATARRIEDLGYAALWIPETVGRDPFSHSAWLLANTTRLVLATGIVNIYNREPGVTLQAQMTLAEQSGDRFLLGLGVSHKPLVEGVRGLTYGKPVATMRTYLERMAEARYAGAAPGNHAPHRAGGPRPQHARPLPRRRRRRPPLLLVTHAHAHGKGNPRPRQVAVRGAKGGDDRGRKHRPQGRPHGRQDLPRAAQLPQQLAANGAHRRTTSMATAPMPSSTQPSPGATHPPSRTASPSTSTPAPATSASSRCSRAASSAPPTGARWRRWRHERFPPASMWS